MSGAVSNAVRGLAVETRVQYGLMFLFGGLCLVATVAPVDVLTKAVLVSALFGLTGGIWIAHLVQVVQRAAADQTDTGDL